MRRYGFPVSGWVLIVATAVVVIGFVWVAYQVVIG